MSQPVAVVSSVPALRRGLATMLRGTAFDPVEPEDPASWIDGRENPLVLVAVSAGDDVEIVLDLREAREDVLVVVLVPELSPHMVREAVLAGVSSVANWEASADEVVALLEAALAARTILPTDTVQWLARHAFIDDQLVEIGAEEAEWLRALARGETVSQLADRVSYSEREMYRLLRAVYDRLGVSSRTEALVWAVRHGIVESPA